MSHELGLPPAQLARQLRRLSRVASDTTNAVVITDAKGRIEWVNDGFFRLTGYRLDDCLGLKPGDFLQGEATDRNEVARIHAALEAGRGFDAELVNYDREGRAYWVEIRCSPLYDETGRLEGFIAIETDITRRKEMEARLRRAVAETERFRFALDQHAILSIADAAGTILDVNARFEEISGYRREELIGQNHRILKSGRHPESFYREMWETITSGHVWRGVVCNRAKDGSLHWVESTIVPFLDENGLPYQYISIRTDVTDLVATQAELAEREERLRRSQRYANIGTWDWNIETGELYWSERIPCLFGYPEGALETSYENFLAAVHPEDRQRVIEAVNASVERDVPYEIEHRVVWPDGTVRWLLERGAVTRAPDGTPLRMLGVVQDIHARKMAELALAESRGRLEEAHRIARLGHWEADLSTGRLFWSAQIYDIFGYDPSTFTPSMEAFYEAVHPDDVALVRASEERALRTGIHDVVHRIVRPDGEIRWVRELAEMKRDPQGRPLRLTGTVQDITALKEAERALLEAKEQAERAKEQAERASRAKSEFLSSMSHELRTPMNAILGFAQLMQMDPDLPAQHRQAVDEILRAGHHLLGLINDVLDLAKVEAGRVELALEPVACEELFRECQSLVGTLAAERGVRLRLEFPELAVRADRLRLKQVLVNLLSNAIKYNQPGGDVRVWAVREGEGVRISVADTGKGIPRERQAELFQPFNRLGMERSDVEGTGIGLVISRRLTEMMGGRIGVDSEVGRGSTFWVWLPRAEVGRGAAAAAAPEADGHGEAGRARVVLYVEDNAANLRLMQGLLARRPGVELLAASTPQAALTLAAARRPDLVLLDINLPEMDGYTLLPRLRSLPGMAGVPVVALTANAGARDVEQGLAAGFADYLTKPLDVPHFFRLLDCLLGQTPSRD